MLYWFGIYAMVAVLVALPIVLAYAMYVIFRITRRGIVYLKMHVRASSKVHTGFWRLISHHR